MLVAKKFKYYNKERFVQNYIRHNKGIKAYFKERPGKFLVINIAEKGSDQKLMDFLHIDSPYEEFSWGNKTNDIS